jgi:N-acetylglucosamine-6-sulfatase
MSRTSLFSTLARLTLLIVMLALAGIASAAPPVSTPRQPTQPNIILLLTDDLDLNLDTVQTMPRLRLLADQGTTFSQFFTSISLCCPSRASILRGQYTHNHQVYTNSGPDGGFEKFQALDLEASTAATWLQGASYRTALFGKYLNGYPDRDARTYVPNGWTEWYATALGGGYSGYNYSLNENGTLVNYGAQPEDYMTDVLSAKATSLIQRTANDTRPLFLYIAPYVPHTPATPAPRHADLFPNAQAPRGGSFNEADVSDKPPPVRNLPPLSQADINRIDTLYRKRLQSMQAVDEMLGALVQALQAAGKLGNTYFFFTSDNGYHLGQHRLVQGKYFAYEEDIRLPLIVSDPGVQTGQTRDHLASTIDLAPTFAALAGVQAPSFVDGRSLVPLWGATPPSTSTWRRAFLVEQFPLSTELPGDEPPDGDNGDTLVYSALRTTRYKYVEYNNGARELYDLQTDPYELDNQYASAPPALRAELSIWLAQLRGCAGETCHILESAPPSLRSLFLPGIAKSP